MTIARTILPQLFADYRAEWPQPYFSQLFVQPPYFPKLETNRPCFLKGGRGTGKTTALKSLRFDAAEERAQTSETGVEALPYFGIYVRINKNRVRAFGALGLDADIRKKAFAHYFNILVCLEFCQLTVWLERETSAASPVNIRPVAEAFGAADIDNAIELNSFLEKAITKLELFVNNGGRGEQPILSMAESPLRLFSKVLVDSRLFENKLLFCCIDEYENLSEEQQAQLNTYIKHAERPLSYKIGLRHNGLRTRKTLDGNDQIATPDDFLEIDIADEGFEAFAELVVAHRLNRAKDQNVNVPNDVKTFLPELGFDEEARLLGCERKADEVLKELSLRSPELFTWANTLPKSKIYFIGYWSESTKQSVVDLAEDWKNKPSEWEIRLGNYGYASLFWLSKGRKGARIRKYYSGTKTLLALASGNIRYFLELIDGAINLHLEAPSFSDTAEIVISPQAQTEAAKVVGKRRLDQLEGLSERGVELKRMVLALGKIFFELARDPVGRSPEQNLFILSGSAEAQETISAIFHEGVSHLALEATPRTKATTDSEMRDDEYRLHPIFCAFFEYSHRRKRRITLSADSLLKLSSKPSQAISELLDNRAQTESEGLPEQLAMFTDFFQG